jgi:hypothetical protein
MSYVITDDSKPDKFLDKYGYKYEDMDMDMDMDINKFNIT